MSNTLNLAILLHILAGLWTISGQTPQSEGARFEVASIRQVDSQELHAAIAQGGGFTGIMPCSGGIELTPGRIRITAATAFRLVAAAYGQLCGAALDMKLITGGPEWIQRDAFHIQATMPPGAPDYTFQQLQNNEAPVLQAMLRNLLADRFHLAVRRTTKDTPIYNVFFVKEGRVKLSADQAPTELSLVSGSRGNFDMSLDRISVLSAFGRRQSRSAG